MDNTVLILKSGIIEIYEVKEGKSEWPNECTVCKGSIKYRIVIKDLVGGFDRRIDLCEEHYHEFISTLTEFNVQ